MRYMSFWDKKGKKKQSEALSSVSETLGEEIAVGKEACTILPALHIMLGTAVVGCSILLGIPYLSYALLGVFVVSGIWILRKV